MRGACLLATDSRIARLCFLMNLLCARPGLCANDIASRCINDSINTVSISGLLSILSFVINTLADGGQK